MKRLIVWGGGERTSLDSFRWVGEAYHETAKKLAIPTEWTADSPEWHPHVFPGDTVLGVDIWSKHIPYVKGARYVLHNYEASHPLYQALGDSNLFLRLQTWTTDAFGEKWDNYRQFDREGKVLFQPWGSELLAEEFMEPTYNPDSNDVVFVGAVWSDIRDGVDLGNKAVIQELKDACAEIDLNFVHYTHISPEEKVRVTREARLAPVVVGGWQCEHGYLPFRAFNSAAYGDPVLTNSPFVADLFDFGGEHETIADFLEVGLLAHPKQYEAWARRDQEIASRYTYAQSLAAIERAFEEMA